MNLTVPGWEAREAPQWLKPYIVLVEDPKIGSQQTIVQLCLLLQIRRETEFCALTVGISCLDFLIQAHLSSFQSEDGQEDKTKQKTEINNKKTFWLPDFKGCKLNSESANDVSWAFLSSCSDGVDLCPAFLPLEGILQPQTSFDTD